MKPYRVEFEFTSKAFTVVVAETPEAAKQGSLKLLSNRGVKDPVVTNVVEDEEFDTDFDLETPSSIN